MLIASHQPHMKGNENRIHIIVPELPNMAQLKDFDVLRLHPNVDFHLIKMGDYIPKADLLILPDSKSVVSDIQALKDAGWGRALTNQLRYGGKVLGICRGFQMLGNVIHDPDGLTGTAGAHDAFGWLMMETTLKKEQSLKQVVGQLGFDDAVMTGDEDITGISVGPALSRPVHIITDGAVLRPEGGISEDNQVAGTHVHGLFNHPEACAAWLKWAGLNSAIT